MRLTHLKSMLETQTRRYLENGSGGFSILRILGASAGVFAGLIFVAMLLPVSSPRSGKHSLIMQARIEEQGLAGGIIAYCQAYGRFPVSTNVQNRAAAAGSDFTYGGFFNRPDGTAFKISSEPVGPFLSNSDVVAILMDLTSFPRGVPPTVNAGHQLNTNWVKFLNAKLSGDTTSPGVGDDLVYRDPWGHPYVITLNLKNDGQCEDAFYRERTVSQQGGANGYLGLFNSVDTNGIGSHFSFKGKVMVWSAGPDGKIDPTKPAIEKPNQDNITSWQ